MDIEGLTGRVYFNEGKRSDIKLDLLKLHQEKITKVGSWTPSAGINITKHSVFYGQQSSNVTLIVVTRVVSTIFISTVTTKLGYIICEIKIDT